MHQNQWTAAAAELQAEGHELLPVPSNFPSSDQLGEVAYQYQNFSDGKAAAEGELPVEECVVCFCAGAHGLIFAENAAARGLKVGAGASFVIGVAGVAVKSCEDRLLRALAKTG